MASPRDSGGPPPGPHYRAGDLIHGGAVATALRAYYDAGGGRAGWARARAALKELFPETRWNSLEAVIALAQGCMRVARMKKKHGRLWVPPVRLIPDARRLLRDAERAHQANE